MTFWTGLATYAIIWWLVIFMVLPWGIRRIDTEDLGEMDDPGAPQKPRMLLKFAITTVLAGIVFGLVYMVIVSGVISFRE
jgi:predicted secreted protein